MGSLVSPFLLENRMGILGKLLTFGTFGLLSDKKVTTVGTTVTRIIEDDMVPNSIRTGVTTAILKDGEIVDHMMEEMINCVGLKADRMYNYAKDHYVHGLPSGQFISSRQGTELVKSILDGIEGSSVNMEYCNYGPANSLHIGWMKVTALYGYNFDSNELVGLSSVKGFPVYLQDLIIVIPSNLVSTINGFALERWGDSSKGGFTPSRPLTNLKGLITPSPVFIDPNASEDFIRVKYTWVSVATVAGKEVRTTHNEHIDLSIEDFADKDKFFHVRYKAGTTIKHWMYKEGLGTYPTLDNLYSLEPDINGQFFPFAYFRFNKALPNMDESSEEFKTSKKMVKYMGIDYETMVNSINDNPDIGQVEQAIFSMAVPAVTTNQAECRYLFDFFKNVYEESQSNLVTPGIVEGINLLNTSISKEKFSMVIQDKKFKLSLNSGGLIKRKASGFIGPIGSYKSEYVSGTQTVNFEDLNTGTTTSETFDTTYHRYRKQITATIYEEIRVPGLQVTYFIKGEHTVTADEEDPILLIPIDRSISDRYSVPVKEELYARSMHLIFNSYVVQTIKWYQTGAFKYVMIIVAVILTIISKGGTIKLLLAALAAGAYAAAAWIIISIIIEQLIVAYLFKLFVKVVGIRIAFIVAIVAAISGTYTSIEAGSVSGAPWAKELLSVSTGLSNAASDLLAVDFNDLLNDASEFSKFVEEQTKTLEEAQELLNPTKVMSPFIIFGETPDKYYNRTIHAGNIGTVGIEAIENFVAASLTLPTLEQTLQEA